MAMKFSSTLTPGSGNLFDEERFKKRDGQKFKAHIAERMTEKMDTRKLTILQSAKLANCSQADIKRIRKGELKSYTVQELVDMARRVGLRVKVEISRPKASSNRLH
jgi:predicted XRE-type DNA-binding protein